MLYPPNPTLNLPDSVNKYKTDIKTLFIYLVIYRRFYPKRLTHYRSNQNQQKSNNMQVLLQVLVSRTQYM